MAAEEAPVIFGDGKQTRDFIHVYDLVKANNYLVLDEADNQLLNISTAFQNSVNQLVEDLNELSLKHKL